MQDSMISALFGAMTCEHRLNITANNLANANTTGYKRDTLAFKDVFVPYAHDKIMEPVLAVRDKKLFPPPVHIAKTRIAEEQIQFEQGGLKQTGSPLDVAIRGDGFFKIQTEDGTQFYSRNGNFHRNADGQLVNARGDAVLAGGAAVEIPPNAEQVEFGPSGQVYADGVNLGQLDLVSFEDLQSLEKVGRNYYQLKEGVNAAEIQPQDAELAQGYLESSNVNVVTAMVDMIETQRAFEAYGKVITTTNETDKNAITRVGRAT